ncbi:MAG: protein kinase [Gemmatimonadaceae bacterium]|nr:protein kinase [Gemmatimonadaceae bacterium]
MTHGAAATKPARPGPRSVASQIFVAGALVVAGALGLVFLLTVTRARAVAERSLARELNTTRAAIEDALGQRTMSVQRLAAGLAAVPTYYSRYEAALARRDLASLLDQAEEYQQQLAASWVMLVDQQGTLAAWSLHPERTGEDFSSGALVRRALAGDSASGAWLEPGDQGDAIYQTIAVPMRPPGGGAVAGALIAALAVDTRDAASLRRQTGSEIVLAVIDSSRRAHVATSTMAGSARPALERALSARSADGHVEVRGDGLDDGYIGAANPLVTAGGDTVGLLVGLRSRRQALAAVDPLPTSVLVAFVAGLLLALGAGLVVSRRIAAPIRALVRATRGARQGEYGVSLPDHAPREIGELADAFHALLDDLRAKDDLVAVLQHEHRARAPGSSPAAGLAPGAIFANRYEIVGLLGAGGMGAVYRVVDRELGETVALKTLHSEDLRQDQGLLDRFREEIRLARRITHRNVVRTHDLGVVDDVYYLTMELVEGRSLDDLIAQEGRLPVGAVQSIGMQMLRALEAAHEVGVVHRDIKPPNLLLGGSGLLKVTDFGIARLVNATLGQRKFTSTGMIVGSPAYMAPEQLAGDPVDARADIYAAGAVLFECLTGKGPHDDLTLQQVFARSVTDASAPDPTTLRPELPPALAAVVRSALAPRPDRRFGSAREMLAALEAVGMRTMGTAAGRAND